MAQKNRLGGQAPITGIAGDVEHPETKAKMRELSSWLFELHRHARENCQAGILNSILFAANNIQEYHPLKASAAHGYIIFSMRIKIFYSATPHS